MAITVQAGTGATTSGATTITPSLPASVNTGDLLILVVDISTDTTATSPGYTEIFTDTSSADRFRVLTKTAGGSEAAPVVTFGGTVAAVGILIRVRDWDTGTGPAQITANASTTTTASIDPSATGSVKIGMVHIDPPTTGGTVTWTGGETTLGGIAAGTLAYAAAAYKLEDTAGAMTFTWSGTGTPGTLILSIAPSAAAPTFVPKIIIS